MATESDFLTLVQGMQDYLLSRDMSEADTRVHLVDPMLHLLGYRGLKDMRREVPIPATREFVDYELLIDDRPIAIVEAKALRYSITDQDAAQCVQYASILGAPWCIITNGMVWQVYYAYAIGSLAAKRVAQARLDGDEQSVAEAWRVLSLLAKQSLGQTNPLIKLLVERVVIDELTRPDSPSVAALRKSVRERFREQVSGQVVLDVLDQFWKSGPIAAPSGSGAPAPSLVTASARSRPARVSLGSRNDLKRLVDAGLIPDGAPMEFTVYGVTHTARLRDGRIDLNGISYDSPSAAASALRGGKAANGWTSWKYRGAYLAELRNKLPSSSANADAG